MHKLQYSGVIEVRWRVLFTSISYIYTTLIIRTALFLAACLACTNLASYRSTGRETGIVGC